MVCILLLISFIDMQQMVKRSQIFLGTLIVSSKSSKNEESVNTPSTNNSSLTFITALFDIKRDKWPCFARNMSKYRGDMINVLRYHFLKFIVIKRIKIYHKLMKQNRDVISCNINILAVTKCNINISAWIWIGFLLFIIHHSLQFLHLRLIK